MKTSLKLLNVSSISSKRIFEASHTLGILVGTRNIGNVSVVLPLDLVKWTVLTTIKAAISSVDISNAHYIISAPS